MQQQKLLLLQLLLLLLLLQHRVCGKQQQKLQASFHLEVSRQQQLP